MCIQDMSHYSWHGGTMHMLIAVSPWQAYCLDASQLCDALQMVFYYALGCEQSLEVETILNISARYIRSISESRHRRQSHLAGLSTSDGTIRTVDANWMFANGKYWLCRHMTCSPGRILDVHHICFPCLIVPSVCQGQQLCIHMAPEKLMHI